MADEIHWLLPFNNVVSLAYTFTESETSTYRFNLCFLWAFWINMFIAMQGVHVVTIFLGSKALFSGSFRRSTFGRDARTFTYCCLKARKSQHDREKEKGTTRSCSSFSTVSSDSSTLDIVEDFWMWGTTWVEANRQMGTPVHFFLHFLATVVLSASLFVLCSALAQLSGEDSSNGLSSSFLPRKSQM